MGVTEFKYGCRAPLAPPLATAMSVVAKNEVGSVLSKCEFNMVGIFFAEIFAKISTKAPMFWYHMET